MKKAVVCLFILSVVACANRQKIVTRTAMALEATQNFYVEKDEEAQMLILADSSDRQTFETRIKEHRANQAKIRVGLQAAWAALAVAALEPTDLNISRMVELASKAIQAINQGGR